MKSVQKARINDYVSGNGYFGWLAQINEVQPSEFQDGTIEVDKSLHGNRSIGWEKHLFTPSKNYYQHQLGKVLYWNIRGVQLERPDYIDPKNLPKTSYVVKKRKNKGSIKLGDIYILPVDKKKKT